MISGDIKPDNIPDPAEVEAMHAHIAELLADEFQRAGDEPDELEFLRDRGYPTTLPTEGTTETAPEQRAYTVEASGQLVLEYETRPDPEPEAAEPASSTPRPATPPPARPRGWRRPRATTTRQKAARDSRPDLKPWPYGSRED